MSWMERLEHAVWNIVRDFKRFIPPIPTRSCMSTEFPEGRVRNREVTCTVALQPLPSFIQQRENHAGHVHRTRFVFLFL